MGSPVGEQHNRRLGLAFFAAYLAAYSGFVYLSAFRSDLMAQHAFAGVNMIQASFTGFCPAAMAFRKLGVKPGPAF